MVDDADRETGNLLRAWREHRQMTQENLAGQIGTTGAVISLLEAGERKLSPKWLRRLAPALGIRPGYLLDVHPDDADDEVIAAWSEIPQANRSQVREIIQTFRHRDGTRG